MQAAFLFLLAFVPHTESLVLVASPRQTERAATGRALLVATEPDVPEDSPLSSSPELRMDADSDGVGAVALAGSVLLIPVLAFTVATALGMGAGSPDNGGIGMPLTTQEVRALDKAERAAAQGAWVDTDRPLSYEEAAEEQALVDILRGGIQRAK